MLAITNLTHYIDYSSVATFLKSLFIHLFFLQNYLPHNPNGPTWSLAVEEHFYILLPLLLIGLVSLARRNNKHWAVYIPATTGIVVMICLTLRIINYLFFMDSNDFMQTHLRIDALLIGVFIQYLFITKSKIIDCIRENKYWFLCISFLLLLPAFWFGRSSAFMFTFGFLFLSIGYGLLLILVYTGLIERWESNYIVTAISNIGVWSYNIYLWQFFLFFLPIPFMPQINVLTTTYIHNEILLVIAHATIFIALSVVVGWLITVLIESPFLRLRDKLIPR